MRSTKNQRAIDAKRAIQNIRDHRKTGYITIIWKKSRNYNFVPTAYMNGVPVAVSTGYGHDKEGDCLANIFQDIPDVFSRGMCGFSIVKSELAKVGFTIERIESAYGVDVFSLSYDPVHAENTELIPV